MMAGKDDAIELVKMATNGLDTLVQELSHTHTRKTTMPSFFVQSSCLTIRKKVVVIVAALVQ